MYVCTYVCTYVSVTLRNVIDNTVWTVLSMHGNVNLRSRNYVMTSCVTCTNSRGYTGCAYVPSLTVEDRDLDNRGRVGQRGWSSATYVFAESSTERSRRLAALTKRKQRSQCTVEAKRARREHEKVQKKKTRCGESSQARYKLCSLFMLDSTVVDFNRALTINF